MPDLAALAAVARGLLPPGCGLGVADPRADHPAFPGEQVQGVPKRLAEFRAGRFAARAALAELGLPPRALPTGPDRAPIWPQGVQGSITHSDALCLAVAGRLPGIGVDLEPDLPLDPALRDLVLRPEEQRASDAQAKLIFSAKEAAYKAQYPQSRQIFDFQAMQITLGDGRFTARFALPVAPFAVGTALQGRWAIVSGHVLTLALA